MPPLRKPALQHVPLTAVVTSRVNVPELHYFGKAGWFKASEVLYRSGEHLTERAELAPAPPIYDHRLLRHGDWARIDGK